MNEIEELRHQFIKNLLPVRIYLFGSYADNTFTDKSDLDFYIVIDDKAADLAAETTKAYKAIRHIKRRPVDIIVGTLGKFEERKTKPTIENEVYKKGILIYDAAG